MTTDAPGDMIRMQNPNQAKRCLPEMAGAAIFIPERRIPSRTLLSFACGITAAPPKSRGAASWTFRRARPQRRRFFHVSENQGKIQGKPHYFLRLLHCCIVGRSGQSDELPHAGHQQRRSGGYHLGGVQFAGLHPVRLVRGIYPDSPAAYAEQGDVLLHRLPDRVPDVDADVRHL